MDRYTDEQQALADGFRIEHQAARQRFVVLQEDTDETGGDAASAVVGEAHYTLLGDRGIDFDHTVVIPSLRGTGLSGLLAAHALQHELVRGREIQASCWYIAEFLEDHPELARNGEPGGSADPRR